jgi:hypothetical protein
MREPVKGGRNRWIFKENIFKGRVIVGRNKAGTPLCLLRAPDSLFLLALSVPLILCFDYSTIKMLVPVNLRFSQQWLYRILSCGI